MKPITEWFKEIKDPDIAAKAFNNFWNEESKDELVGSVFSAICYGFTWSKTPEGKDFWSHLENYM